MSFVVLITGASSGIGEATARLFARRPGTKLVLVARREDRLTALAAELGGATVIAADLTEPGAPERAAEIVEREYGALNVLVNNAGASWRGTYGDTGWANVDRHMKLNFEAPLRLIEALLPVLSRTAATCAPVPQDGQEQDVVAPVSIVNVASTASRVSRPSAGAYSASKFALAGWSDAFHNEQAPNGIHVGLVLPGFVATEGFPATELKAKRLTSRIVSTPDTVAEAIFQAGPGGKAERYVPRYYWIAAALRLLAPSLTRRVTSGGALTTTTPGSEN